MKNAEITLKTTILLLFLTTLSFSQGVNKDSLWRVFNDTKQDDTSRLRAIDKVAYSYVNCDPDTSIAFSELEIKSAEKSMSKKYQASALYTIGQAFENKSNHEKALENFSNAARLYDRIGNKQMLSDCYFSIGSIYHNRSDYFKAMDFYLRSLKINEILKNKRAISNCYGNIGNMFLLQSNYPKAMEYFLKSLSIAEATNNQSEIGNRYNDIGTVYAGQAEYSKALEYYMKSLKIEQEIDDKDGISICYNNIADFYERQNKYSEAMDYILKSLKLSEEINNKDDIGIALLNIGHLYFKQSDYQQALAYSLKSLKIYREIYDKNKMGTCYSNLADIYLNTKNYKSAIQYGDSSIEISKKVGDISDQQSSYKTLSDAYAKQNNYKEAYENFVQFKALTDSIFNTDKSKQLGDMKTQFEVDKKETELKEKADAQQKVQQTITLSVAGVLLIVFVFSIFLFRRFKVTQRQKVVIEKQKHLVEEHQKEIVDSITYAKRLQNAILPPIDEIKNKFPESFLMYRPKDIVAGDFYWMENVGYMTFVAVADCTGHGVSGAMLSVVCSNALNKAVNEFRLTETGMILDKTRELVLETFAKSGEDIKDGMDISLLSFNNLNKEIQWSGAFNPLWYVESGELKEIKANKQPIGKTDNPSNFTTHSIEYKEDTIFYLMTDGYADQFGGEKGKKFMYKRLGNALVERSNSHLEAQKDFLCKSFDDWKGILEQVDDVTIMGIRIA